MNDPDNLGAPPIQELAALRARVSELEHQLTAHRQVEKALLEKQELFSKIFDHSNDAIFLIDPARDEILNVNARACSMLQYSHEELLSLPITAIHPKEMPKLLAFANLVFAEGSGWTDELTCLTRSGEQLLVEMYASAITISGETCLLALVKDVTERNRVAEMLRASEGRLRSLYVVNKGQSRLYRNDGPSGFSDVTESANLIGQFVSYSMAVADYDNDRDLDSSWPTMAPMCFIGIMAMEPSRMWPAC